jgi:hypothetical protein
MFSPTLLEALRDYWRGLKRKPTEWLFPGGSRHTSNRPITPRAVWYACQRVAQRVGLQNILVPSVLPITCRRGAPWLPLTKLLASNFRPQTTIEPSRLAIRFALPPIPKVFLITATP